jgi:hypothetical protein
MVDRWAAGYAEAQQVIYNWPQAYTFKMGHKGKEVRSLITCVLFPQPMLPFIKLNENRTPHSFEATNLGRMMIGANSHYTVRRGQSETDLCCMETMERSVHDNFFNAVPFSFKPQLKSGGNPAHDRMPVKLRLSEKVNWLSPERSDADQRLTVKFLGNWCFAMLNDLKAHGRGSTNTSC